MYIVFDVRFQHELDTVKEQIAQWAEKYQIQYTQKTIKYQHRLGLNRDKEFTLFSMTWEGAPYTIVNIGNEGY
jgi:hypothetical protein